jgi:hypothetical protein
MKALGRAFVSGLSGALLAVAHPAGADERACAPMILEQDDSVEERWPGLASQICRAFREREGVDSCARVELAASTAGIRVGVTLPDGRSASRSVSRRDDVVPTLEALLSVPALRAPADGCALQVSSMSVATTDGESSRPTTAASSATTVASAAKRSPSGLRIPRSRSVRRSPTAASTRHVTHRDDFEDGPREAERSGFNIELSLLTRAGAGAGQTRAGVSALSFIDISGWLVGFEGRADGYELTGDEPHGAFELALLGGHRFRARAWVLDLILGPALALEGVNRVDAAVGPSGSREPPPVEPPETSSGPVPRLILGAHVGFDARPGSRFLVGIEGEFGADDSEPALAPVPYRTTHLPSWTVSLALGATVGTR